MAFRSKLQLQCGPWAVLVNLDSAIEKDDGTGMKNVCGGAPPFSEPHELTPLKQRTACPVCDNTDRTTLLKARPEGPGLWKALDPTEIEALKDVAIDGTNKGIAVTIHPVEEVETQVLQGSESTYFLTPSMQGKFAEPYHLLVDVVRRRTDLAFLTEWTAVSRTTQYQLKVFGNTLVMEPRCREDEVKVQQVVPVPMSEADQGKLDQLVDLLDLVQPYDPAEYADRFKVALADLMAKTDAVAGAAPTTKAGGSKASAPIAPVLDLTAMLDDALAKAAAKPKAKKGKAAA